MSHTNETVANRLKEIADCAYRQKDCITEYGLINGRMGLCVNLYHIARYTGDDELKATAESLLDEIYKKINMSLPIHFSNGLTGIAWGIQHLISESFVNGDPETILRDIDILETEVAKFFSAKSFDFSTGIMGQMIYILSRLKEKYEYESLDVLRLRVALISLTEQLDSAIRYEDELFSVPLEPTRYWNPSVAAQILAQLRKTGIYKSRVEDMTTFFKTKIASIVPGEGLFGLMHRHALHALSMPVAPAENRTDFSSERPIRENGSEPDMDTAKWYGRLSEIDPHYKPKFKGFRNDIISNPDLYPPEYFISEMTDGYGGFYKILSDS